MKWLVYEWRQLRSFLLAYGGVWGVLFIIALFYFMQPQYRSNHADGCHCDSAVGDVAAACGGNAFMAQPVCGQISKAAVFDRCRKTSDRPLENVFDLSE